MIHAPLRSGGGEHAMVETVSTVPAFAVAGRRLAVRIHGSASRATGTGTERAHPELLPRAARYDAARHAPGSEGPLPEIGARDPEDLRRAIHGAAGHRPGLGRADAGQEAGGSAS